MNRRALLASLAAGTLLGTRHALARPSGGARRIGCLMPSDSCEPFEKGAGAPGESVPKALAKLGHVEVTLEWRCFAGDFKRGAQMAADLVRRGVDILYTNGTSPTQLLLDATKTIPILTVVGDPVGSGFTRSLVRPDGNITGLSLTRPDTPAKQIELLRRIVPKLDRLVLIGDVRYRGARELLRPYEIASRAAGLRAEVKLVDRTGFEPVFSEMKGSGAQAAFIQIGGIFDEAQLAKLAIRHGVPTMLFGGDWVKHGGLMSFHMYHVDKGQREVAICDKLLRGIKPADIPWELPDRSHFAINLGTAKLLGLKVTPDLLLRADEIVE